MHAFFTRLILIAIISCAILRESHANDRSSPLKITHSPAPWAIKGQSLTLRAKVSGGSGGVESVTLYYALFRDAAPFRVNMASSGMDMYVGTIEAGLLSGLSSISYYIEAQDKEGSLEETPWYDVQFKDPDAKTPVSAAAGAASGGGGRASGVPPSRQDEERMSGLTMGLIAGGAVALGAGAYFLADSGGDDDSGGGSDTNLPPNNKAGTYDGNSTLCRTLGANPPTCANAPATIIIETNGRVFSDTLLSGTALSGTLSGNNFSLSAPTADLSTGLSGSITFSGTVVDNSRIVGSISGSYTQGGTNGTYSGTFTLNK